MATIIISAPIGTTGYTITAPSDATTTVGQYITDVNNIGLAVSIPTTATGRNFSSVGRTAGVGTSWRLRNGLGQTDVNEARLNAYNAGIGAFDKQYFLPAGTDTFVTSDFTTNAATHILSFPGFSNTKAAGTQAVAALYRFQANDTFELRGSSGNDILTGGSRNDVLLGNAGNDILTGEAGLDTLTGGTGSDQFVFNNLDVDTVTDFAADGGDVFAFQSGGDLIDVPAPGTTPILGDAANAVDDASYIIIDTLANIQSANGAGTLFFNRFAYATDTNQILYSSDGFTSSGVIANVTLVAGAITTSSIANFAFVA